VGVRSDEAGHGRFARTSGALLVAAATLAAAVGVAPAAARSHSDGGAAGRAFCAHFLTMEIAVARSIGVPLRPEPFTHDMIRDPNGPAWFNEGGRSIDCHISLIPASARFRVTTPLYQFHVSVGEGPASRVFCKSPYHWAGVSAQAVRTVEMRTHSQLCRPDDTPDEVARVHSADGRWAAGIAPQDDHSELLLNRELRLLQKLLVEGLAQTGFNGRVPAPPHGWASCPPAPQAPVPQECP
jgi:hypothetical protein